MQKWVIKRKAGSFCGVTVTDAYWGRGGRYSGWSKDKSEAVKYTNRTMPLNDNECWELVDDNVMESDEEESVFA